MSADNYGQVSATAFLVLGQTREAANSHAQHHLIQGYLGPHE